MKTVKMSVCCTALLAGALVGAAPAHVQTADYFGGYAGTKNVPAPIAARWLSWAETGVPESGTLAALGVRTILYSNPHRTMPGDPLFTSDESTFAHDCAGARVNAGNGRYPGLVLMNPAAPAIVRLWRQFVDAHQSGGHFDAVFEDEAVGDAYADRPCGFSMEAWLSATIDAQRRLGYPVIYNGLEDFNGHEIAPEIALNASAIGGMMEECYAQLAADHRVSGWQWTATEDTELRMARERKYFFCYGRDLTPAEQADASRMFVYASFLLSYDLDTSVLWEYYHTASGGHVMPESLLVARDPIRRDVASVDALRMPSGIYARAYRACFINGRAQGGCIAAVNPDSSATRAAPLTGYSRTLTLHGSGIFDGGTVSVDDVAPPSTLQPLQGVIAFK